MVNGKLILIPFAIFLLTACNRAPQGVLGRQKMEEVLVDFYRTDGVIYASHLDATDPVACDSVRARMLRRHGVTQAQFDSSMSYYNTRGSVFQKMYLRVDQQLSAELRRAQQAAFWAEADARFCWIGWPEGPTGRNRQSYTFYHETLPESHPLFPLPAAYRYGH